MSDPLQFPLTLARALAPLAILAASAGPAYPVVSAVPVAVGFGLDDGTAAVSPIPVDLPDLGIDLVIEPVVTFGGGGFTLAAASAALSPGAAESPAVVSGFSLAGGLEIEIDDTILVGPISLPVQASISGPLSLAQRTGSVGSLVDATRFIGEAAGDFVLTAGLFECSDNAFGLVCGGLETALGVEFPIAGLETDLALPLAITDFADLGVPGAATAGGEFEFSIPIGAEGGATLDVLAGFEWSETSRAVVPEPATVFMLALGAGALVLGRRRGAN